MPEKKFYKLDGDAEGLIWLAHDSKMLPIPYCKKHKVKLIDSDMGELVCPEDYEEFKLRHNPDVDADLAHQKIFNEGIKNLEIVRIDPEGYQVLAKKKTESKSDPRYWVEVKLSDTSKGLQLMIQAGKKSREGKKVQLFVEPSAERVGFDHNSRDQHPSGLFTVVEAIFKDSTTSIFNNNSSRSKKQNEPN